MASDRPLDDAALRSLALRYVSRYATTETKLRRYLSRKLFERGWADDVAAPVDTIIVRMVELGYVDDQIFAEARGRSLTSRGFGSRRVAADLAAAGIERETAAAVVAASDAFAAALAFARRRRLGPFDPTPTDPVRQKKAFAAMMRAGHGIRETRLVFAGQTEEEP